MKDINADLVSQFIMWLEEERHCGISTRNQRLMAIRSFFRYVQGEQPQNLLNCQKVLNIPPKKRSQPVVTYLTVEELKLLLAQPNTSTPEGRRDLALLCILYDTGGRVQEIADLTVRNIRLDNPAKVHLTGKGRKSREVPLLPKTVQTRSSFVLQSAQFQANTFWDFLYPK
jgi:site-specific recombinase XerD